MSEQAPDYKPVDLRSNTDVGHPDADSIQFVTVPGKEEIFLYLWDCDTGRPVTSVVGFDAQGVEKLQNWLTNADLEARGDGPGNYGENNE